MGNARLIRWRKITRHGCRGSLGELFSDFCHALRQLLTATPSRNRFSRIAREPTGQPAIALLGAPARTDLPSRSKLETPDCRRPTDLQQGE
jgi:hypothetical protein